MRDYPSVGVTVKLEYLDAFRASLRLVARQFFLLLVLCAIVATLAVATLAATICANAIILSIGNAVIRQTLPGTTLVFKQALSCAAPGAGCGSR